MLNTLFSGVFDSTATTVVSISNFILCIMVSLIIGSMIAVTYSYHTQYTKSFLVTLAMLPTVVCVVIMMVNGNVGTGVAVAGAFSLVRFRSAPGSAKEIGNIFLAMGAGLITGMGYLGYAVLFTLIMCAVSVLLEKIDIGIHHNNQLDKTLRITIPEDLQYETLFDDLFEQYASAWELVSVKTTNMGSLFKLMYHVTMKESDGKISEKKFIDDLRCRNGNLEISMSRKEDHGNEL